MFGEKGKRTWQKEVLFDTMGNPTDVVVAIEEFANNNKDNAVSAFDCFVDKENDNWYLVSAQSLHCVWFLKRLVWNEDEEEMKVLSLGAL